MECRFIRSENKWQQIQSRCTPLADYAHVFRGAIVGTQRKATQSSSSKKVLWLPSAAGAVPESFRILYENPPRTKLYPDDFERERSEDRHAFEGTKVLVVRSTDTSWGRRSKVAVERRGYYVSGSFHVVVPRSDKILWSHEKQEVITNEVLAAIIYWYVGNAWIIEHTTSLGIPKYAIETIPFPNALTADDCNVLKMAIIRLQENDGSDAESFEQIDRILKRAYGLDEATFEHLREITRWDSKTQIIYDRQPDLIKANCFVSCHVESIDAQQNAIALGIKGIKGAKRVQITTSMQGAFIRPGGECYTRLR